MKRGKCKSGVWYRSGDLVEYLPGDEPQGSDLELIDEFFRHPWDGELWAFFVQHPDEPWRRSERVENIRKVVP